MAERAGRRGRQTRHQLGQLGERGSRRTAEPRISGRATAKARAPAGAGATSAVAGRRARRRPATSARSAAANERRRRAPAARFVCRTSSSRRPSPRTRRWRAPSRAPRGAARMKDEIGLATRLLRARKTAAERRRDRARGCGSMSISSTSAPGSRAASAAIRQPTTPAPITAIRSPGPGAASHRPLIAVSMLAASVARRSGTSSGTSMTASCGTTNRS